MSQPMDDQAVTANQARAEYVAKCNEIIEIELVLVFLDQSIANSLNRAEPVVAISNDALAVYASKAFWQLLDLYREAHNRRLDLYAARDYAYAVWKSASSEAASSHDIQEDDMAMSKKQRAKLEQRLTREFNHAHRNQGVLPKLPAGYRYTSDHRFERIDRNDNG
jgi:hypothetical protein